TGFQADSHRGPAKPGWNLVAVRSEAPRSPRHPAPRHRERRYLHPLARPPGAGLRGAERAPAARVRRLADSNVPDQSLYLRRDTPADAGEARASRGSGDRESGTLSFTGTVRDAGRFPRNPGGDSRTEPPRIRPFRRPARFMTSRTQSPCSTADRSTADT